MSFAVVRRNPYIYTVEEFPQLLRAAKRHAPGTRFILEIPLLNPGRRGPQTVHFICTREVLNDLIRSPEIYLQRLRYLPAVRETALASVRRPPAYRLERPLSSPHFRAFDADFEPHPALFLDADWELLGDEAVHAAAAPASLQASVYALFDKWFVEHDDPGKKQKYRVVMSALQERFESHFDIRSAFEYLDKAQNNQAAFHARECLLALCHPERLQPAVEDPRKQHEVFLDHLRKGLLSQPQAFCRRILEQLAYDRYSGVAIDSYLGDTVDRVLRSSPRPETHPMRACSPKNIAAALHSDYERIKAAPYYMKKPKAALALQKLSGTVNLNFDPPWVNTPYVRGVAGYVNLATGETRQRRILRHGTPTFELGVIGAGQRLLSLGTGLFRYENAQTVPEYQAFLAAARDRDENVAYFNHQKMIPSLIGDESDRCLAIQKNEKIFPNFFFTSLPLDGDFINLRGDLATLSPAAFSERLADALLFGKSGYCLPRQVREQCLSETGQLTAAGAEFRGELLGLFRSVWDRFFAEDPPAEEKMAPGHRQEPLTPFERRQAYLLLCHSCLKDFLNARFDIKHVVSPCKDHIDRGNASTGVDEARIHLELGTLDTPDALRQLRVNTAAPPFLVKKQEILPSRLIFLELVLRHFASLSSERILQIQRTCAIGGWMPVSYRAPKDSGFTAVPSPRTAKTMGEFHLFLGELQRGNQWPSERNNALLAHTIDPFRRHAAADPLADTLDREAILSALVHQLPRTEIHINGVPHHDAAAIEQAIRAALSDNNRRPVPQREISQILSLLLKQTRSALLDSLEKIFHPNHLQIQIDPDPAIENRAPNTRVDLTLDAEQRKIRIQHKMLLVAPNQPAPVAALLGLLRFNLTDPLRPRSTINWRLG